MTRSCRLCSAPLVEFLDLGPMPLSNRFLLPEEVGTEFWYHLVAGACPACSMVQLSEAPDAEQMFTAEYPYLSSGSAGMRSHFEQVARSLLREVAGRPDPLIVELGSNDGAMLRTVADNGVRHLGVEPSRRVAEQAASRGVSTLVAFFTDELAASIRAEHGPADIIFAANTVCHVEDLRDLLDGAARLLGPDGMLVFEDPYLGDVVAKTAFDQIYDEHVYYFSVASVAAAAAHSGLQVVEVEHLPVHGGELRYRLAHQGRYDPKPSVADWLAQEERADLGRLETLGRFAERVHVIKCRLGDVLAGCHERGERVVGYGATAKSATVTNFCAITTDLVEFVCDTTPAKQGRLTPGAHLPVRPPAQFADPYPDVALLFAWNHEAEIRAKEQNFAHSGGRWLRYIPAVVLAR